MFQKAKEQVSLAKCFFNEASTYYKSYFSTSTLNKLEKENDNTDPEDKSLETILYIFSKAFIKMYIIRIGFMSLSYVSSKGLKGGILKILYESSFNKKNFNTAFFVGLIPTLYTLLHKIGKNIGLDTKSFLFTFLSGIVSGYIGISAENITDLVKFMILSLLGRVIHSIVNIIIVKNNITINSKLWSYSSFSILCVIFNLFNYYVPDFKPIKTLFDKYGLLTRLEKSQLELVRSQVNIFAQHKS